MTAPSAAGEGVFAFVGSLLPEPDAELLAALRSNAVPMVATLGVARGEASEPQFTTLLPSLAVQVRQLAAELALRCGTPGVAALLLHPPGALLPDSLAGELAPMQSRAVGDAGQLETAWLPASGMPVIALLNRDLVAQLRQRLFAASASPCMGTLAVLSGQPPREAPPRGAEVVALPMPPLLDDAAEAPGARLWPLLGDVAARVFAEALARSGRGVDAAQFARALDTLHRFQPLAGLSVSFDGKQRHGFDVAYVWRESRHATTPR